MDMTWAPLALASLTKKERCQARTKETKKFFLDVARSQAEGASPFLLMNVCVVKEKLWIQLCISV